MINIRVSIEKQSFKGWIQDNSDKTKTLQGVEVEDGSSCLDLVFKSREEWEKFIKLYNVPFTDTREKAKS